MKLSSHRRLRSSMMKKIMEDVNKTSDLCLCGLACEASVPDFLFWPRQIWGESKNQKVPPPPAPFRLLSLQFKKMWSWKIWVMLTGREMSSFSMTSPVCWNITKSSDLRLFKTNFCNSIFDINVEYCLWFHCLVTDVHTKNVSANKNADVV